MIYKILGKTDWDLWQAQGQWTGSADDLRDGFVHLSTAAQVLGTRRRHFSTGKDLLLVGLDRAALTAGTGALRLEASARGTLYPHWYGALPLAAVRTVEALGH